MCKCNTLFLSRHNWHTTKVCDIFQSKPSAPVSGTPALEKPIMLIKTREEGGKPGTAPDVTPSASGAGTAKLEREGQRPTQPVYQIQNRGMGSAASGGAVDRKSFALKYFYYILYFPVKLTFVPLCDFSCDWPD